MTTIADTDLVKDHLRITSSTEDTLIGMYLAAAKAEFIQRTDEDIITNWDNYSESEQYAANVALCLMVGDSYENREATSPLNINVNKRVEALLNLFRWRDS